MSNDNTIKKIKYLLKGLFYTKIKCYDKALYNYQKSIKYNLSPYKKRINYNELIEKSADLILKNENLNTVDVSNYPKKILILNSEIYDTGGHTELALRYAEVFHDKYPIYFYITNVFKRNDDEIAPEKSKIIRELVSEFYISSKEVNLDKKIIELYNYIIEKKITTISYSEITDSNGKKPFIEAGSEIVGKAIIRECSIVAQKQMGGGMLGGASGIAPMKVTIVGAGVVGTNAAKTRQYAI